MKKRTSLLLIAVVVLISAILTGCGEKKSKEEKMLEELQAEMQNVFGGLGNQVEAGTPEAQLQEISSYLTELWNDGFVNISWYASRGTNSVGDTIDIELLVERLGKTVEKKEEYDTYIAELGEEYDEIKSIWPKLSAEIDKLNDQLQTKLPEANVDYPDFDTGLFKQYNDVYDESLDALIEKAKQK